jgi:hypothetical protein
MASITKNAFCAGTFQITRRTASVYQPASRAFREARHLGARHTQPETPNAGPCLPLTTECCDVMHFLALDLRHSRATSCAWGAGTANMRMTKRFARCGVVADALLVVNGDSVLCKLTTLRDSNPSKALLSPRERCTTQQRSKAMCRWTLGTIQRRCGVTVLVKPLPESPFSARIPGSRF